MTTKTTFNGEIRDAMVECPIHGKVSSQVAYSAITDKWYSRGCPLCEKEEQESIFKEEDERIRKENEKKKAREIEKKFSERGIPKRYQNTKIDDYIADTDRKKEVLAFISNYIKNQKKVNDEGRSLLLYGNIGTGKTRLATSIVKGWEGVGRYITAREYTRLIRSTYSNASEETEQDVVDRFAGYSILVIDEIGRQFSTDSERHAIFDIINTRYNDMKPTVIVSNMNIEGVKDFLGEATLDRIKENNGQAILFDWESFR